MPRRKRHTSMLSKLVALYVSRDKTDHAMQKPERTISLWADGVDGHLIAYQPCTMKA
jgi:hypothetical protein